MFELVLPFGLPPDELSRDLLAALQTPALAQLLARTSEQPATRQDGFAPCLPHETWLEQQLGALATLPQSALAALEPALAPPVLSAGDCFMLFPVHLHIARDHLVLTDQRQLAITTVEAHALFTRAATLFDEVGLQLIPGDSHCWFVRAGQWQDMQTCTLDAACGHNVDIWMPKGTQARNWRKLQNEVQMCWFDDPVNLARQAQGLPVINSLWLQRISTGSAPAATGKTLYRASVQGTRPPPAPAELAQQILYADTLISPALAGDWAAWLDAFAALDANWFAPLLANKATRPLHLHFSHSQRMRHFTCKPPGFAAFLTFWRSNGRNGLQRLAP